MSPWDGHGTPPLPPDTLLAGITEAFVAVDEDWRFAYVNDAAEDVLLRPRSMLLGLGMWDLWPAGAGGEFWHACQRVRAGGAPERLTERSVGERWLAVTIARIDTGVAIMFHDVSEHKALEARAAWLAAKEAAQRSIAIAVAGDAPPDVVFGLVAERAARLLRAHVGTVVRFEDADTIAVMGSWADGSPPPYGFEERVTMLAGNALRAMRASDLAMRRDALHADAGSHWRVLGVRSHVAAPVHALGRLWGGVSLGWREDRAADHAESELSDFTDLVGLAVDSLAAHARLAAQASTDPLTGLLNHRAFNDRVREEVRRAQRYGRPLSLAVFDLDGFKPINDAQGHQAGDALLTRIATDLARIVRAEDVLGRLGGDEFGLLLPETPGEAALDAVDQARGAISATRAGGRRITASAGVCDLRHAADAADLVRLADGALYWSKAHGRDTACLYDPLVVRQLNAEERAEQLARTQALLGLRGLARAIDAKDPSTRRHSDRVATLAALLAEELGWERDRIAKLREAGLVHDVGKIGVPDAVLLKPGRLTPEEYETIKHHAALGATIVDEVLAPEQVAWVRHHHERPDGGGYPDGLGREAIPDGAALLAVADAFDVMTVSRPYSAPKPVDHAVSEVAALAGRQFQDTAAAALASLHASGRLAA